MVRYKFVYNDFSFLIFGQDFFLLVTREKGKKQKKN